MNFEYITPQNKTGNIIKVVGVGGGGNNAVNNMFENGIYGVDFFICNTDHQALLKSPIPVKIQIGNNITSGLGCGADPNVGKLSAEESIDELKEMLKNNTKMVFVTAGMGGGTGTGAAPVIARLAKEMGILTVGIVTSPFRFEGDWRKKISDAGILEMQDAVDTLLIINNENLFSLCPKNTKIKEAYRFADQVLYNAAKGIAEIITREGYINVDFADVQTIMKNGGTAIMGTATFSGENRAQMAVEEALASPLLDNVDLQGATGVLFNVSASEETMTLDEVQIIGDYIKNAVGPQARIIYGQVYDDNLGDDLSLTVIATGFGKKNQKIVKVEVPVEKEKEVTKSSVHNLFVDNQEPEYKLFKNEVQQHVFEEKKEIKNLFETPEIIKETVIESTKVEQVQMEDAKTEPLAEEHQNVSEINQKTEVKSTINHRQDVLERKNMTRSDYQDPDKLRDLEKIPAYERYNLNVSIEPSKKISRMSIQGDEHGSKFRENNSFLDDLVD